MIAGVIVDIYCYAAEGGDFRGEFGEAGVVLAFALVGVGHFCGLFCLGFFRALLADTERGIRMQEEARGLSLLRGVSWSLGRGFIREGGLRRCEEGVVFRDRLCFEGVGLCPSFGGGDYYERFFGCRFGDGLYGLFVRRASSKL